jgi:hypothetical protein
MSTNVLSNVGLILNVCEKSSKNTKVTRTKTGAVPWLIISVFPKLNHPPRYRTLRRSGRFTLILFPVQPFLSPLSSSCLLPPPSSSSSSWLLLLLRPPHPFPLSPTLLPYPSSSSPPLPPFSILFSIVSPPPSPRSPFPYTTVIVFCSSPPLISSVRRFPLLVSDRRRKLIVVCSSKGSNTPSFSRQIRRAGGRPCPAPVPTLQDLPVGGRGQQRHRGQLVPFGRH